MKFSYRQTMIRFWHQTTWHKLWKEKQMLRQQSLWGFERERINSLQKLLKAPEMLWSSQPSMFHTMRFCVYIIFQRQRNLHVTTTKGVIEFVCHCQFCFFKFSKFSQEFFNHFSFTRNHKPACGKILKFDCFHIIVKLGIPKIPESAVCTQGSRTIKFHASKFWCGFEWMCWEHLKFRKSSSTWLSWKQFSRDEKKLLCCWKTPRKFKARKLFKLILFECDLWTRKIKNIDENR